MPVVELSIAGLRRLVGAGSKKSIVDALPFLGLDIEDLAGDDIRIEYSPNRPDYSTCYGIAVGLQGLLGVQRGVYEMDIGDGGRYQIVSDRSVAPIRPYVTGIAATGGRVGDRLIQQIMAMQEDLHFGLGRRRRKVSMGVHDLDRISFPLSYTTVARDHRFVPLDSDSERSVDEILAETAVGQSYGRILDGFDRVPAILDASGATISLPPIINSAATAVTTKTRGILVEVTGTSRDGIEDALAVSALVLQKAGFALRRTEIGGPKNSAPGFNTREMSLSPRLVNDSLGTKMSAATMVGSLKKCRLDASYRAGQIRCRVPRYRFDIFGPMDLVEEVALGYGIERLEPVLSPSEVIGERHRQSVQMRKISQGMIGLGYTEALNSSLTSNRLYELAGRSTDAMLSVLDSKSQEHTILRDSLLVGLVENLSRNVHEAYPQRLFETGRVFASRSAVSEKIHLACISSHRDAAFTETKSALQSLLQTVFGLSCQTKKRDHDILQAGRSADIVVSGSPAGIIGELDSQVASGFKLRAPAACFELSLSGLIFD